MVRKQIPLKEIGVPRGWKLRSGFQDSVGMSSTRQRGFHGGLPIVQFGVINFELGLKICSGGWRITSQKKHIHLKPTTIGFAKLHSVYVLATVRQTLQNTSNELTKSWT